LTKSVCILVNELMKFKLSVLALCSVMLFGCVSSNTNSRQSTYVPRNPSDPTLVQINSAFKEYFRTNDDNTEFRNKELLKSWDSFIGTKIKAECKVTEVREGGHVSLEATQMGVDSDEVLARYENPWNYPSATILAQTWGVNFYIEPTNFEDVASSLRKGQVVFVEGSIKKLEHKSTRGGYIGKGSRSEMLVPSTQYFTIDLTDSKITF
jgi:hypothetical protein